MQPRGGRRALGASELDLSPELILRHIGDGLILVDLEGTILYANDAFGQIVGRDGADVVGRRLSDLLAEDEVRRILPAELLPLEDEPVAHFNVGLSRPDGSQGAYCFTACPVRDAEGRLVALLENFRGMDRLRDVILGLREVNAAIEVERRRTEQIVNSIADGIFTVDEQRRILSFSQKMAEITGIPARQAEGRACEEVLRGSKCGSDCPLSWSIEHGQVVDGCREVLRVGGRDLPVAITTAFLLDEEGRRVGLTGVLSDRSEVERLHRELEERYSFRKIIGRSRPMQDLFEVVEAVSGTDATVLISGESGTGKELVARAIHYGSSRRAAPFVVINCAALSETLLESELFGHVQGAFTGAVRDKVGRFELADGGTIFLDEIGDTSPAMQAKLLRVLEERTFERVGEARTRSVDVRVLAATHRDLLERVRDGRFREDLYYRLAVVPIRVPPLRERRDDIPLLVDHFIAKYARRYLGERGGEFRGISNRALAMLLEYPWPGNVRELEHAVEYALISAREDRIERAFLPATIRGVGAARGERGGGGGEPRPRGTEVEALLGALERNRWQVGRTARELGISRTTLWRRMKRLGIERDPAGNGT
ncbi:MAG TPA: PAS domain-containing protein [Acidobacteria bacterium]|nr:PAS domain-containing protein [Acidobacteriota bacterium]